MLVETNGEKDRKIKGVREYCEEVRGLFLTNFRISDNTKSQQRRQVRYLVRLDFITFCEADTELAYADT